MEDIAHEVRLTLEFAAPLADRREVPVHGLGHVALELACAARAYLGRDLLGSATRADRGGGEQGRDTGAGLGIKGNGTL